MRRKLELTAAAAALIAAIELMLPTVVYASTGGSTGKAGDAGIWFDWNGDDVTNGKDWKETSDWLKSYTLDSVSSGDGSSYVRNGNNEAADSIKSLIFQQVGSPSDTIDYGIDVEKVPRYCINNVGLGTPAGDQTPYGTCWAFAENAAVESAVLRERSSYSGNKILQTGTGTPVLVLENQKALMSPLYLATKAFSLQTGGSQKGEGITFRAGNTAGLYNAGGFLTTVQIVYGNWDGPVSEANEPYSALINRTMTSGSDQSTGSGVVRDPEESGSRKGGAAASRSEIGTVSLGTVRRDCSTAESAAGTASVKKKPAENDTDGSALLHDVDPIEAHLQDYYIYSSPAVTEENAQKQLRVWKGYSKAATDTLKQALVKYGALAIMNGTDGETPGADGMTSTFNYKTWMQYSSVKNVTHNHAVTIVGWDDTIPASSFSSDPSKQPEGNGAWLVKNSWGSYENSVERYGKKWIDDYFSRVTPGTSGYYLAQQSYNYGIPDADGRGTGYFWLSYYDRSIAGAAAAAEVDIPDDGYDYQNNYTYQYAISLSNTALVFPASNIQTKVCNVFTANNNEFLKAVSVEAPTTGITAEIEVYTYDAKSGKGSSEDGWNPEKGTLAASKTVAISEMGMHTVRLNRPVPMKKGQKFSVVERIISPSRPVISGEKSAATTGKGNAAQSRAVMEGRTDTISWLNLETAIADHLQTPENYSGEVTKVVANPGETWAYVQSGNGKFIWVQPKDLNQTAGGGDFQFGNALIHAYTSDR